MLRLRSWEKNKPQGRPSPHGERRFGDAPEAFYVEPKPPDPSWINPHQTSCTQEYLIHPYLDFKSVMMLRFILFQEAVGQMTITHGKEPWMIGFHTMACQRKKS